MYRTMELFSRIAITLGALFLLVACQGPAAAPTPSATPEHPTIALSLSTLTHPFNISMQKGAQEAANRLGAQLIVQNAQANANRQRSQLEELVERRVDALIINPVNGEGLGNIVARANDAGIPVLTLDSRIDGGQVLTHIASDNISGGQMAAEFLAATLSESGRVVELEGTPGTSVARDRGQGFDNALANYPQVELAATRVANFDRWQSKNVFEEILAGGAEVDAVFAHNDQMILGAIEAAQEAGRADEMIFVGFDGTEDAVTAIERGDLTATIVQQPAEMGRIGVELAIAYLQTGEPIPEFTPVDLALVAQ